MSAQQVTREAKRTRWVVGLLGVSCLACFGPWQAVVGAPSPNYAATRQREPVRIAIDVQRVGGHACASAAGSREMCVDGFDRAFYAGLQSVVDRFFVHDQAQGELIARFELVEYFVDPAAVNGNGAAVAGRLGLKWRFSLVDLKGTVVAQAANTTVSSRAFSTEEDLAVVARSVVEAVVEEIATGINHLPVRAKEVAPAVMVPET